MTYIAPTKSNGAGNVWVKLAQDGYSASTGKWAVDTLIANKGKHSITIPDLAAGEYLLRPEIIALHEGDRASGAQFYMECVQIKVTSAGAKTLPAGVAIPGTYTATDPGILFNLYSGSITSYTFPGPAVWNGASGGAAPVASSAAAVTSKAAVTSAAAVTSKAAVSTKAAVTSKAVVVATSAPVVAPSAAPVVKTTLVTLVRSSTKVATVVASPTAAPATGGTVGKYMQCGGVSYKGATACESGWTCKVQNPYYSQCVSA
jgi:cellulase